MRFTKSAGLLAIIAVLVSGYVLVSAESAPKIADVPEYLSGQEREELNTQRALLTRERNEIREETDRHNQRCTGVEENSALAADCAREQSSLEERINAYSDKVKMYNENVQVLKIKQAPYGSPVKKVESGQNAIRDFSVVNVQDGVSNAAQLKKDLLDNFSSTILQRTAQPNEQAQEILRSFKMKEPPSLVKNITDLALGDVILVAPTPKGGNLKDALISNGINLLDKWGSDNWTSPASHAAIFLGERNGKRWYLDNTSSHGPVIKEEEEFLKEYGQRPKDVATLVGQPLSEHEGQELWKGAHELRNTTTYGPSRFLNWRNDAMVCSEASRWALVRAGRRVPETQSGNAKIFGINIGLNKKRFVNFSPSDFYENQQYFVVHQLGMQRRAEEKP